MDTEKASKNRPKEDDKINEQKSDKSDKNKPTKK